MLPLGRYFLHAHRIRFRRPSTGMELVVEAPLPAALAEWMEALERV
jgi:23S rRNA-/tRNA-specific pseudouridylate synthase